MIILLLCKTIYIVPFFKGCLYKKKSEIKYSVNSQSRFYFLCFKCLVKIIDCVCSKLCHFHSRVAFLGGEPHFHIPTATYFWSLLKQAPSLYFITRPPTHPCIFHKTHTSGPISLVSIFYVMLCFFLKVVENWDLPPKAARQAIKEIIWVRKQSEKKRSRKRKMRKSIRK